MLSRKQANLSTPLHSISITVCDICVTKVTNLPFELIFFKWANPGLFLIYFLSFQTNNTIFTTNQCKKYPCIIQRQDLNRRPLKHESSPITTRPGLPPYLSESLSLSLHDSNTFERATKTRITKLSISFKIFRKKHF